MYRFSLGIDRELLFLGKATLEFSIHVLRREKYFLRLPCPPFALLKLPCLPFPPDRLPKPPNSHLSPTLVTKPCADGLLGHPDTAPMEPLVGTPIIIARDHVSMTHAPTSAILTIISFALAIILLVIVVMILVVHFHVCGVVTAAAAAAASIGTTCIAVAVAVAVAEEEEAIVVSAGGGSGGAV